MKYTNYILSDKVININAIQTKNPVLVLPMAVIGVPIVILGLLMILFILPAATAMDQVRRIKYFLLTFERKNNYQYGSQTHISNLFRDYIRTPYLVYLGSGTSRIRRLVLLRKEIRRDWLSWSNNRVNMGRLLPYLGWIFLVVNIFK